MSSPGDQRTSEKPPLAWAPAAQAAQPPPAEHRLLRSCSSRSS